MSTRSAEVMHKYNRVAQRCATVIIALLKTLDNTALYELFNRTKQGEEFLVELCSYEGA